MLVTSCSRLTRLLLLSLLCFTTMTMAAEPRFPALSGRIVDQAGLLADATEARLSTQLEAHENQTSNQVVVATISDLQGHDIADFGVRLGRHWQIGQQDRDNGVVLLVAPNNRKVRIEVGYGLEGALPDALASDIIERKILPAFREGNFDVGIEQGVGAILQAIEGEYQWDPKAAKQVPPPWFPLLFMGAILFNQFIQHFFKPNFLNNGVFPAAFAGIFGTIITGRLWVGLLAAGVILAVIGFGLVKLGNGGTPGQRNRSRRGRDGFGGFGGGGGGGFGGGGGSFGGGGASGGW